MPAMGKAADLKGRIADGLEKWQETGTHCFFSFVLMMTAGLAIPEKVAGTDKELEDRAAANTIYEGMKAYGREHKGCFYFQDVYSAVSYPLEPYKGTAYSEKMFAGVDNRLANYDIMGGWLVKSPSQKRSWNASGYHRWQRGFSIRTMYIGWRNWKKARTVFWLILKNRV